MCASPSARISPDPLYSLHHADPDPTPATTRIHCALHGHERERSCADLNQALHGRSAWFPLLHPMIRMPPHHGRWSGPSNPDARALRRVDLLDHAGARPQVRRRDHEVAASTCLSCSPLHTPPR
ncbi:uncharacterized protein LOC100502040 [Zea mays]|uniref:Uncharacterized protein n=1 Tax=Zea mays TaxID=4577 RepID=C4J7Y8_MAIZE|nr:uncharacterized protein LOC100502040 [Zea mays]ACR37288.1 unknown [Zea mays]|eukprot:NP_001183528.1 uncharacterized protein LOC100502040 [Zea mays]